MDLLQAVAQPRRREILRLVWDRELSAGQIAARFDVTFAAVSQHLAVLREAELVSVREEGRRRLYRADRTALRDLRPTLEKMWASKLDRLAELVDSIE